MNLTADEEEENRIRADDDQAGNEEGSETSVVVLDVAHTTVQTAVVPQRAHNADNDERNTPAAKVVPNRKKG